MVDFLLIFLAFAMSFIITGATCRYAEKLSLIDVPNVRSSHSNPTPRGGGIAIVISFTSVLIYGMFTNSLPIIKPYYYLAALLLTAAVGFWDDLRQIPTSWRFTAHLLASLLVVLPLIGRHGTAALLGFDPGHPMALLAMVILLAWLLNLYNFMDGIDGFAASEAIFITTSGAVLLYYVGDGQLARLFLALAAGSAGFLFWNWPPARIFMGDVGSGFLGLAFGGAALYSSVASGRITIWPWLILLGIFLVDSTYTLTARFLHGQRWYAAHCTHTYQLAAIKFRSHRKVTLASIFINIFWLFPLAFLATKSPEYGIHFSLIAFAPLICLAIFFKAGHSGAEN